MQNDCGVLGTYSILSFGAVHSRQVPTLVCRRVCAAARLAQSVEHETLNLRVVGSSPTLGVVFAACCGFQCHVCLLWIPVPRVLVFCS